MAAESVSIIVANAVANAVKASGAIVKVAPEEFSKIVNLAKEPLIVVAQAAGFLSHHFEYLLAYKGFVFFTKSSEALPLRPDAQVVSAEKIWIPELM
jgi:hypothetical protein